MGLIEAVFALFLLLLMALLLAATLPVSARSTRMSADYIAAQALVNKKIVQLQNIGYGKINGPSLGQNGEAIVDGTPTDPTATKNADGSQSFSFPFTATDALGDTIGVNATTGVNVSVGTVAFEPYAPSAVTVSGVTTYSLIRATVSVRWADSRGQLRIASGSTLIPKANLN
jgi:type II secretory pathway pseudopilin PulG